MIRRLILSMIVVIFGSSVFLYANSAGQPVIDLGKFGKLIRPVHINDKWFYYWDRSGDGTIDDRGNLNGGMDYINHDLLGELFNHDINGRPNTKVKNYNGSYSVTSEYRYGTINGVKLALPTVGENDTSGNGSYYLQDNQPYTDLAAIWDSHNKGFHTSGAPNGWHKTYYWSATPSAFGHALVDLSTGYVDFTFDFDSVYVILEVL